MSERMNYAPLTQEAAQLQDERAQRHAEAQAEAARVQAELAAQEQRGIDAMNAPKSAAHKSSLAESNARWNQQDQAANAESTHNGDARQAEIRGYDDAAELRLFGSRGRKYVDANGNALPTRLGKVDQAKKVTAEAKPHIDQILVEPDDIKNRPQPIRDAAARQRKAEANRLKKQLKANETEADLQVKEVLGLVKNEGLSLSQAELVVELRRADVQHKTDFIDSRTADLQSQGVTAAKARRQAASEADALYSRKDAQRLNAIKANRLYTENEYRAFTGRGRNTPAAAAQGSEVTDAQLDEAYAENKVVDAERKDLREASDRYIELSAQMRSGHIGRVAGGRLHRLWKQISQGVSGRKSDKLDKEVAAARQAYMSTYAQRYSRLKADQTTANQDIPAERINANLAGLRLDELTLLESSILARQIERTEGQKFAGVRNRIARRWAESGRFGKVVMVAVPAAAIGVGGGLVVGALGLGMIGSTVAGIGTAYAGRKTGHGLASVATTNRANSEAGHKALEAHSEAAKAGLEQLGAGEGNHTIFVEHVTDTLVHENQRRRGLAGAVGALAAGAGFGITRAGFELLDGNGVNTATQGANAHHGSNAHHGVNAHHTGGHHTGGHHTGHGHNAAPQYDTHQYPWQVAHQMNPGHEMSTIHHAMNASNANVGTNYHLVHAGNTMQVYNGGHALNPAQQAAFNAFMESIK